MILRNRQLHSQLSCDCLHSSLCQSNHSEELRLGALWESVRTSEGERAS